MNRDAAIIDAGQKRARPIIMTTIAMVAGMMPSALSFGAGGEIRSPMALAVIGGLIFSTVLSLIFVPAMFSMMDDLSHVLLALLESASSVPARRASKPMARRQSPRPIRRATGHSNLGKLALVARKHSHPSWGRPWIKWGPHVHCADEL